MIVRRILFMLAIAAGLVTVAGATPALAAQKAAGCAAYVYSNGNSLCSDQPGSADRNCPDIGRQVQVIVIGIDPWGLDRDDDGQACETLPPGGGHPATTEPTATATATASAKPSPSHTQGQAGAITPDDGTGLAKTGPRPAILAIAGAVVLAAGIAIMMIARRRRLRFHA